MCVNSLNNKRIVITRPTHQSHSFAENIKKEGGCAITFPLVEITPLESEDVKKQLNSLANYDVIVFISVNAVLNCLRLVDMESLKNKILVTVGKKSAQALNENELDVRFCPERFFNSEALLQVEGFKEAVAHKKVAIIRGSAGRNYLKNNLISLGAQVDYIDVYKRYCPQNSLNTLKIKHDETKLDTIVLTSASSTAHFFELAKNENWINELSLLLGSQRMQHEVPATFDGKLFIADDPSDETLLERLIEEHG